MIINGEKVERPEKFDVKNPYNGELISQVSIATKQDIENAMKLSYETKKNLTVDQRVKILKTAAEKIKEQRSEIAQLITSEAGLSLKDTLHEVHRVINVLEAAANEVQEVEQDISSRFVKGVNKNPELKVVSEPLDLVLGITPFNHPMNQVAHKLAPAIASGTAIVLKPSEKTPLSATKLIEILHESGLPKNFVNLITTNNPSEFLDIALSTKLAQMVTFTGGIKVGKLIQRKLVETENELVKYIPELGGNSALIVLDDADIEESAKIALNAFANSGQRCTSTKRIILHNKVADQFIEKFLQLTKNLKYGGPNNLETDMGTVINEQAAIQIQEKVEQAIKDGAKLIYGNKRQGALYSPTILDNVNPNSRVVVEETFGPVAPIIRIDSINQAIEIINSGYYKLAGAVMTKDKDKAEHIADSIKVGQFNWNNNPGYRTEHAPFGGFGNSGNGQKEGVILATEGMRRLRTFYTH